MSEMGKCGNCDKCKCPSKEPKGDEVTFHEEVGAKNSVVKYKTLRYRTFAPITGRVQTVPTGGMLVAYWNEGDVIKATMVVCPKHLVFHKPTSIRKLDFSKTCTIRGLGELDIVFATDVSDAAFFEECKTIASEIYDSASTAFDEADRYKERLKYSGASVYKYAK